MAAIKRTNAPRCTALVIGGHHRVKRRCQEGVLPERLTKFTDRVEKVDEDIGSTTAMADQLVEFCQQTKEAVGSMLQIIVTDHPDELELSGEADFQSFVSGTWRKRGFIADLPAEVTASFPWAHFTLECAEITSSEDLIR